jgi:hypothetical protein
MPALALVWSFIVKFTFHLNISTLSLMLDEEVKQRTQRKSLKSVAARTGLVFPLPHD